MIDWYEVGNEFMCRIQDFNNHLQPFSFLYCVELLCTFLLYSPFTQFISTKNLNILHTRFLSVAAELKLASDAKCRLLVVPFYLTRYASGNLSSFLSTVSPFKRNAWWKICRCENQKMVARQQDTVLNLLEMLLF